VKAGNVYFELRLLPTFWTAERLDLNNL